MPAATSAKLTEQKVNELFPPERTDAFFEALFGGAEQGAYTIQLSLAQVSQNEIKLYFELHRQPGQCLVCNLTHGLPQVFARHPVINVRELSQQICALAGWPVDACTWKLGNTEECSAEMHRIPFFITLT